jgi:hypothetical protein
MKDFDAIKDLWQQSNPAEQKTTDLQAITRQAKDTKAKLMRPLLISSIILFITPFYLIWVVYFSGVHFNWVTTHISLALMCSMIWLQSILTFFTLNKLRAIDDTALPELHLQKWEAYYAFRKNQLKWNMPLYFTVLTVTMGLYFVELIQNWPIGYILLLLIGFIAWMIYSYFVWGKRIMQKEENRLTDIIDTLKQKTEQLKVN